jgi:hypothetical protein
LQKIKYKVEDFPPVWRHPYRTRNYRGNIMRKMMTKTTLAVAIATVGFSPVHAGPVYATSQSIQDLSPQNELASTAYFKFSLGGKARPARQRFRTGLSLQMRNVLQAQSTRDYGYSFSGANINLLDLSMSGQGLSSLQLNGVPLQDTAYRLNAKDGEGKRSGMRTGLMIAGGVIVAIGVAAAAAGGGNDNENNNDHSNGNDTN